MNKFFKWGSIMMIITGILHLIGHFMPPALETEDQQKMVEWMTTLQFDLDGMFSRSVMDLFNVYSLFLTVMLIGMGLINYLLINSNIENNLVKKISLVNVITMLGMLALSFVYAFSVPIVLFATTMMFFILAIRKAGA